jgi:hypothetical protein
MNRISRIPLSLLSVGLLAGAALAEEIEPTWESMAAHYQVPVWNAAMPTEPDPACVSKAQRL